MSVKQALVRLSKWKVDQVRRKLMALAASRAEIEQARADLEESVLREQRLAADLAAHGECVIGYGGFAQGVIARREKLSQSLDELDTVMAELRAQVNLAYRELKKYEIAEERDQARARRARSRRQQQALDEVAAARFQRTRRGP